MNISNNAFVSVDIVRLKLVGINPSKGGFLRQSVGCVLEIPLDPPLPKGEAMGVEVVVSGALSVIQKTGISQRRRGSREKQKPFFRIESYKRFSLRTRVSEANGREIRLLFSSFPRRLEFRVRGHIVDSCLHGNDSRKCMVPSGASGILPPFEKEGQGGWPALYGQRNKLSKIVNVTRKMSA